jgi:hypothetical protein
MGNSRSAVVHSLRNFGKAYRIGNITARSPTDSFGKVEFFDRLKNAFLRSLNEKMPGLSAK